MGQTQQGQGNLWRPHHPGCPEKKKTLATDCLPETCQCTAHTCRLVASLLRSQQSMTNYHLTPPTSLPSHAVQEAKAKRRKVLEAAAHTRKANYERFLQRMASLDKTIREKN